MTRHTEDEDAILKDGQILRVPFGIMMTDQRRVAHDVGDILSAGTRRPHQMSFSDADNVKREKQQRAYDARTSDAWRKPVRYDATPTPAPRNEGPFATEFTRAYDKRICDAWRTAR